MKYKYFVTSDIHSFYSPLIVELNKQGFEIDNKRHRLIVCGDLFDRDETIEVYNFIKSLSKNRRILIRGNHEYLLRDCLKKDFPSDYDFHNGTVKTICQFANVDYDEFIFLAYEQDINRRNRKWKKMTSLPIFKKLIKWIFESKDWVDYYEYKNYVFVHSFIPLISNKKMSGYSEEYNPDWRNASREEFEEATWRNPFIKFDEGYFNEEIKNNKILVCGHWHCSDFHKFFEHKENDWSIYKGKNLIAIDKCTALTKKSNVLVIDYEDKRVN